RGQREARADDRAAGPRAGLKRDTLPRAAFRRQPLINRGTPHGARGVASDGPSSPTWTGSGGDRRRILRVHRAQHAAAFRARRVGARLARTGIPARRADGAATAPVVAPRRDRAGPLR